MKHPSSPTHSNFLLRQLHQLRGTVHHIVQPLKSKSNTLFRGRNELFWRMRKTAFGAWLPASSSIGTQRSTRQKRKLQTGYFMECKLPKASKTPVAPRSDYMHELCGGRTVLTLQLPDSPLWTPGALVKLEVSRILSVNTQEMYVSHIWEVKPPLHCHQESICLHRAEINIPAAPATPDTPLRYTWP